MENLRQVETGYSNGFLGGDIGKKLDVAKRIDICDRRKEIEKLGRYSLAM